MWNWLKQAKKHTSGANKTPVRFNVRQTAAITNVDENGFGFRDEIRIAILRQAEKTIP